MIFDSDISMRSRSRFRPTGPDGDLSDVCPYFLLPTPTYIGDLRVLHTADVPELRHLRDVVVFPCVGDRPEPSKMSGGDLDGDIYAVVWDKKLLPPKQQNRIGGEWNYEPMSYDPPAKPERDGEGDVKMEASKAGGWGYPFVISLSCLTIGHASLFYSVLCGCGFHLLLISSFFVTGAHGTHGQMTFVVVVVDGGGEEGHECHSFTINIIIKYALHTVGRQMTHQF